MDKLKFFVFGIPYFEQDGQRVAFQRSKGLALMTYLVAARQPQSRDRLCELLWADFTVESARGNLRRELSLLNGILPENTLIADRTQVVFNPHSEIEIDLYTFWEQVTKAGNAAHIDADIIAALEIAVEVYRNDFLAGFTIDGSTEFDDWQYFEAESIRRAYAHALQTLITWFTEQEQYSRAIDYARRWVALDPLHEAAQQQLISALAFAGEYADALRQYQNFEKLLRDELDVLPEAETVKLYDAIRTRQFQPRQSTKTVEQVPLAHNLAAQMTPFVGREVEITAIQNLLQQSHSRLVTVAAAGGMGKTRLALEVAQRYLASFQGDLPIDWETVNKTPLGGIYFIDLTPLADSSSIVQTTADTIGYKIQADNRTPRQQILDYLSNKTVLLIFDNYEHLLDDALFVSEIFQAAPNVRLLVTSREPLNLQEETVFRINGMDYPDIETSENWLKYSAIQLLVSSAKRVQPHFELHEVDMSSALAICRAVGGMPLGIMLATAWLDTFTLAEVALEINNSLDFLNTEVRNLAPRHRNIRAVFDSSWQRLSEVERDIFMQLSVFRGGFTLQAAQRVIGVTLPQLARLVKKSLLQRDMTSGRYSIHELLRQYAQERLEATGKAEGVYIAYSCYYLEWLAHLEADIKGRRQLEALDEVEADIDNVRTAWQLASNHHDFELLNQALESFYLFHDMFSHHHEGLASLRLTLTQLGQTTNDEQVYIVSRIQARIDHLSVINFRTDFDNVFSRSQQHWQQAQKRADKSEMGYVLGLQAWYYLVHKGSSIDAMKTMEKAVQYYREANDNFHLADGLDMSGTIYLSLIFKDAKYGVKALESLREGVQLRQQIGDAHGRMYSLRNIADFYFYNEQYVIAAQCLAEIQQLAIRYRNRFALSQVHYQLTNYHFYKGDFALAREHLAQFSRLIEEAGYRLFTEQEKTFSLLLQIIREDRDDRLNEPEAIEQFYSKIQGKYPEPFFACLQHDFQRAKSAILFLMQLSIERHHPAYLSAVGLAAIVLAHTGFPVESVEIFAYTLSQPIGFVGWLEQWYLAKRVRAELEAQLGSDTYQAAWERGKALDSETVAQKLQLWLG